MSYSYRWPGSQDIAAQRRRNPPPKVPLVTVSETGARPRWLLSGASSGIGLALVRLLEASGQQVVATGRRQRADLPTDFPDIAYVQADLSDAEQRTRLIGALPDALDVAVLCAGAGYYRALTDETAASISEVLAVNLTANVDLARQLYPKLHVRRGVLGLIGSVAYKGARGMPIYASTKAAFDGFGRSLRSEWADRVDVRVIHPGPTATGMAERAGLTSDFAQRLMLPVEAVSAGVLDALRGPSRLRRTISYGSAAKWWLQRGWST